MSPSARRRASFEMRGPRSAPSTWPAETLSALAFWTSSGIQSALSPTNTATLRAMQRCPAAPKAAPTIAFSAAPLSASGMIVTWFFAAVLACTFLPWRDPNSKMWRPALSPPTKEMALILGSVHKKSTVRCVPWTTFSTPSGRPACCASSQSIMAAPGSFSDGFSTKVLPHVTARGNIQSGIMAGKLKGQIPAQIPKGCR
mmetsp:Transcript_10135/g.38457  ORF Transcript_10135/g.38457 Transcript_10135/m.38457 type:complete len:200 (-) Transcript_10135:536-1135(-)